MVVFSRASTFSAIKPSGVNMRDLRELDASQGLRHYGQFCSREEVPEFKQKGFRELFGMYVGESYRCFMVLDEP